MIVGPERYHAGCQTTAPLAPDHTVLSQIFNGGAPLEDVPQLVEAAAAQASAAAPRATRADITPR